MAPSVAARIRLIHGEERYLVDRDVLAWRQRAAGSALKVEVFESPAKLDALRRSVMELPLLDPERTILVRDPPQLTAGIRKGVDPPEGLASLLGQVAPTTSLCLVAHGRVAAQNPVLAAVRRLRGTISYHPIPRPRELRSWLEAAISERGLRLPPGSVDLLVRTTGSDLGALSAELDKLAAFAPTRQVSSDELRRLVSGDEPAELWQVLEHLLGPAPARGAAALAGLLDEGRSSQHLLAVLAGQARDLLLAQSLLQAGRGPSAVAAELRIPEWRAERLARQAEAIAPTVVAGWIGSLHEADRRAKAGEIGDAEALRIFALQAAQAVAEVRG